MQNGQLFPDHALISLQEELDLINDYVELEKMRFEDRLQVNFEVEPQMLNAKMLPLSLQSLVENAIKHGIAQQPKGGVIFVNVTEQDGALLATVRNPGRLQMHTNNGLGLKNLQERLQLQFNGEASFTIEALNAQIVMATLKIPLQWTN